MKELDPYIVQFLLDHPMARAAVYSMMRNAACLKTDPKMVEWYAPVKNAPQKEKVEVFIKLCKH